MYRSVKQLNSLDPDQDRLSVGHHRGSNCLQESIGKFSTGMRRVITGKCFSVKYIISYRLDIVYRFGCTCICIPEIFGHFIYIQHAMSFKQSKRNIQRIYLESVYFQMLNGTL